MWRFYILLLIAGSLFAEDYTPLTYDEAYNYIQNSPIEQVVNDILRLDAIEHTPLVIPDPVYGALVLKNDDLIIFPNTSEVDVNLYDLKYRVTFRSYTITDFAKPLKGGFSFKSFMWGLGSGLLTGLLIGIFAG